VLEIAYLGGPITAEGMPKDAKGTLYGLLGWNEFRRSPDCAGRRNSIGTVVGVPDGVGVVGVQDIRHKTRFGAQNGGGPYNDDGQ
jgi:hypothetical protein